MPSQPTDTYDLLPIDPIIDAPSIVTEKRLNNRYIVGKELGKGGLCIIYAAQDIYSQYYDDDRSLAIKLPLKHLSSKSDIDAFMYAEYSHLSRLSHPNIVKVIDFGIDKESNIPYLVLERLKGRLLNEIPFSALNSSIKRNILKTLLQTTLYLRSQHIVHADINPTNIMCLDDGSIKLFDFGISINLNKKQLFELDYKTVKAYNPRYAAPEIIEGAIPDQKSDLFSIAVVLFELYSGYLPYKEQSIELYKKPILLRDLRLLPLDLRYWLKSALSAVPEKRKYGFPLYFNLYKCL